METTKNTMPEYSQLLFNKIQQNLDTTLYFFGSIQRDDYFPNSSDIDVAIFTDNIKSTVLKLQSILNVTPADFKQFVWKLNYDNSLVNGHKIIYKEGSFLAEFSIYDEKYKNEVLVEHNQKMLLPFYATYSLILIKYLFYQFHIIPTEWYIYLKNIILHKMICIKEDQFVVL
jgi:hypothetical protein